MSVQFDAGSILGIPEFFISEVQTEIDGPNVRVVCGVRRAGEVQWLYSAVMRADLLLLALNECSSAALEALETSIDEIMRRSRLLGH